MKDVNNLVNNRYKLWGHIQDVLGMTNLETQIKEWEEEIATTKKEMSILPPTDRKVAMIAISSLLEYIIVAQMH